MATDFCLANIWQIFSAFLIFFNFFFYFSSLIKGDLHINLIPALINNFFLVGLVGANSNLFIFLVIKIVNKLWVLTCYQLILKNIYFFLERTYITNILLTCRYLFSHTLNTCIKLNIHIVNIFFILNFLYK